MNESRISVLWWLRQSHDRRKRNNQTYQTRKRSVDGKQRLTMVPARSPHHSPKRLPIWMFNVFGCFRTDQSLLFKLITPNRLLHSSGLTASVCAFFLPWAVVARVRNLATAIGPVVRIEPLKANKLLESEKQVRSIAWRNHLEFKFQTRSCRATIVRLAYVCTCIVSIRV